MHDFADIMAAAMNTMYPTEQAIEYMRKAERICAFSGAGISTEAGIPDFRGPGGMWEDSSLLEQLSVSGFNRDPEGFYRSSMKLFATIAHAKPTLAHQLLVQLEKIGKLDAVITQNIDGLHHAAGSSKVFEVHGTYRTGHCTKCNAGFEMAPFYAEMETGRLRVPLCPACGVPIKPDIVLFEELLPYDVWNGSQQAAEECDLMLVLGSSLVVYPAAELPMIALEHGARLIIVNMQETPYDRTALTVRGRLGDFAKSALAAFMI
jgi:NAD-dependent deacetylase